METVIDAPKSKSISIAYHALKSSIFCLIILKSIKQISSQTAAISPSSLTGYEQKCKQQFDQLSNIQELLYIFTIILDSVSLLYFYCTINFSRLQFYVFYLCHLVLNISAFLFFLTGFSTSGNEKKMENSLLHEESVLEHQLIHQNPCYFYHIVQGMLIFINLLFALLSIFTMMANLYIGQKFMSVGCNFFWIYCYFLLLTVEYQQNISIIVKFIAFIHFVLSTGSLVILLSTYLFGKTSCMSKIWRILMFVSFVMMMLNYLLSILESLDDERAPAVSFFVAVYRILGPFEMVSPLLFLIFVRLQWEDPRKNIIKKYQNIFRSYRENQEFNYGQVD